MRKANKPKIFEDLLSGSSTNYSESLDNKEIFVLDGGNLLHKIKWEHQKTFAEICASYIRYVKKQFGGETRIVFDGYPMTPTTKDQTHAERTKGTGVGSQINFSSTTPLTVSKEVFLSNLTNKQAFINLLTDPFKENGITVICAENYADMLIATTAIDCSKTNLSSERIQIYLYCCVTMWVRTTIKLFLKHKTDAGKSKIWLKTWQLKNYISSCPCIFRM